MGCLLWTYYFCEMGRPCSQGQNPRSQTHAFFLLLLHPTQREKQILHLSYGEVLEIDTFNLATQKLHSYHSQSYNCELSKQTVHYRYFDKNRFEINDITKVCNQILKSLFGLLYADVLRLLFSNGYSSYNILAFVPFSLFQLLVLISNLL